MAKASDAIDSVATAKRDQSSMTMAIDTSRLPEAKERIKQFRRELAQFLSRGGSRDEVYQLSISLFPLSDVAAGKKQNKLMSLEENET